MGYTKGNVVEFFEKDMLYNYLSITGINFATKANKLNSR